MADVWEAGGSRQEAGGGRREAGGVGGPAQGAQAWVLLAGSTGWRLVGHQPDDAPGTRWEVPARSQVPPASQFAPTHRSRHFVLTSWMGCECVRGRHHDWAASPIALCNAVPCPAVPCDLPCCAFLCCAVQAFVDVYGAHGYDLQGFTPRQLFDMIRGRDVWIVGDSQVRPRWIPGGSWMCVIWMIMSRGGGGRRGGRLDGCEGTCRRFGVRTSAGAVLARRGHAWACGWLCRQHCLLGATSRVSCWLTKSRTVSPAAPPHPLGACRPASPATICSLFCSWGVVPDAVSVFLTSSRDHRTACRTTHDTV